MESMIRHDFSFPPKSSASSNSVNKNPNFQQQHSVHSFNGHRSHYNHNNNPNHLSLPPHHQGFAQHHHHQQQQQQQRDNCHNHFHPGCQVDGSGVGVGLCKSASTSLLSGASSNSASHHIAHNNNNNNCYYNHNHNNNNNNNNNDNGKGHSNCTSCNSRDANHLHDNKNSLKGGNNGLPARNHYNGSNDNQLRPSNSSNSIMQGPGANTMIPTTPKDSDCSFTFDDLKSTLAFMEDSPLVSAGGSNGLIKPGNMMIIPSNAESTDAGSAQPHSSGSASSDGAASEASSAQQSLGQNGTSATSSFMPKSTSNPGIVLSSSSSNASTTTTSPSSSSSSLVSSSMPGPQGKRLPKTTDCGCASDACSQGASGSQNSYQQNQSKFANSAIDLLMKKSSSDMLIDRSAAANGKPTNNALLSLIANPQSQQQQQQQQQQSGQQSSGNINCAIESAAKKYRCAAQISEATCCWKGKLPPKQYKIPIIYSTKVFVGGLPWDITEEDLIKEFGVFGPCRVEWTNKEKYNLLSNANGGNSMNGSQYDPQGFNNNNNNSSFRSHKSMTNLQSQYQQMMGGNKQMPFNSNGNQNQQGGQNGNDSMGSSKQRLSPGFAYVIYENEYSVRTLVSNCIEDYQNGRDRVEYYFKISTRRVRNKEVQIIPWILADNNIALCTPKELDPKKTVFVGNLHGTMTARDLAHIMNELFGCVLYAGIDIDKLKYPIGSGRVTFSHQQNFMKAVRAAFVDIQSSKFSKRIQIDPYLEDVQCCVCMGDKGIYFCRDFQCFNYYCGRCWDTQHSYDQQMGTHKPLMRKREDKL